MMFNGKCKVCGGELISVGDNVYQCKYCMEKYYDKPSAPQVSSSSKNTGCTATHGGSDVFERNIGGVLEIFCSFGEGGAAGSGLLIDSDGYAITNAHVISNQGEICDQLVVLINGDQYDARIISVGDEYGGYGNGVDLALLKIDGVSSDTTPLTFANFKNVKNGEQVYVIGNSLGDGTCITSGIVSDKSRILDGQRLLMTDCAINGGNSGGPIFNGAGEVIGVIVCSRIQSDGSATEGMNYAIPADTVEEFIKGKLDRVQFVRNRSAYKPHHFVSCPKCGATMKVWTEENYTCKECGNKW